MRTVCVTLLALASAGFLPAADSPVVFRSDVSLVRVDAQVIDRDNRPITGLRPEDFVLREEGRPQPIRNFARENMPVDVLLLLDVSGSMRPHVQRIASAARQAMEALGKDDRVAIMVFDRTARLRLPFRSSRDDVDREFKTLLRQETFNGGTDIAGRTDRGGRLRRARSPARGAAGHRYSDRRPDRARPRRSRRPACAGEGGHGVERPYRPRRDAQPAAFAGHGPGRNLAAARGDPGAASSSDRAGRLEDGGPGPPRQGRGRTRPASPRSRASRAATACRWTRPRLWRPRWPASGSGTRCTSFRRKAPGQDSGGLSMWRWPTPPAAVTRMPRCDSGDSTLRPTGRRWLPAAVRSRTRRARARALKRRPAVSEPTGPRGANPSVGVGSPAPAEPKPDAAPAPQPGWRRVKPGEEP